jgi:ABC-2 type transport system ATP-binding protein
VENLTVFFSTHYMEEAERVSDRIAIIDHGRIVAQGSAGSLEDAFLALTGRSIREAEAEPADRVRVMRQVWGGLR